MVRFIPAFLLIAFGIANAATITLSQQGLRALDHNFVPNGASVVSSAANGNGIEYLIAISNNLDALYQVSSTDAGTGALVGIPVTPGDTFALQFTLLSTTAAPDATINVGALINRSGVPYAYTPFGLGGIFGNTVVAGISTDASSITLLGFRAAVNPGEGGAWPVTGGQFRLLVAPAPGATVIAPAAAVPEPATISCVAVALACAALYRRRF